MTTDDTAAMDAMLAAAGLQPSDDEKVALGQLYATFKPGIDALYALPAVRYEAPALVFQAAPKLDAWGA
ncbi:MAG TPA: hypothetical protein VNT55_01165 [Baekduia sp.]|nr:hypothetical protein [Baekduia sp.]